MLITIHWFFLLSNLQPFNFIMLDGFWIEEAVQPYYKVAFWACSKHLLMKLGTMFRSSHHHVQWTIDMKWQLWCVSAQTLISWNRACSRYILQVLLLLYSLDTCLIIKLIVFIICLIPVTSWRILYAHITKLISECAQSIYWWNLAQCLEYHVQWTIDIKGHLWRAPAQTLTSWNACSRHIS